MIMIIKKTNPTLMIRYEALIMITRLNWLYLFLIVKYLYEINEKIIVGNNTDPLGSKYGPKTIKVNKNIEIIDMIV